MSQKQDRTVGSKIIKITITVLMLVFFTNAASQDAASQEKEIKSTISQFEYSELVILADVRKTKQYGLQIDIKKVLKGDPSLRYKTINVPQCIKRRKDHFLHYFKSKKTKNSIILFSKKWLNKPCDPIYNVFHTDSTSEKIKVVLTHQSIANERKRLKLLLKLIPTTEYKIKRLVFDQFEAMKNPKNFYLFKALVDKNIKCQHKKSAMDTMVRTYDLKAVPYLIDLLSEDACEINLRAAKALSYEFAGAKGVTAALTKSINNPKITKTAKKYLSKRYSNPSYQPLPWDPTPFYLGNQLLKKGDTEGAVKLFLSSLDMSTNPTPCSSKYGGAFSGIKASLPYINQNQVERIYTYLSSIDFSDDDFHFRNKEITAQFFYHYPKSEYTNLIFELLKVSINERDAMQPLTLLISSMDTTIKDQANDILEHHFFNEKRNKWQSLISMFWFDNHDFINDLFESEEKIKNARLNKSKIESIKTLMTIPGGVNDHEFLKIAVKKLNTNSDWKLLSTLIRGLSQKPQADTFKLLTEVLESNFKYTQTAVQEAFIENNNPEVNQIVSQMMHSKNQDIRGLATKTLYKLKQDKALNDIRKAYLNEGYGDKYEATYLLGLIGEASDIEILSPECDFWNQPKKSSERTCQAINRLRSKYHYDVNGPIVQSSKMNPYDIN